MMAVPGRRDGRRTRATTRASSSTAWGGRLGLVVIYIYIYMSVENDVLVLWCASHAFSTPLSDVSPRFALLSCGKANCRPVSPLPSPRTGLHSSVAWWSMLISNKPRQRGKLNFVLAVLFFKDRVVFGTVKLL